ncbi:uncharacterized protein TNCV_916481 [Trichonephila clavipes]|nr:uncharacterized protein TNCV_916481 [Trichonephila clavipes]
MDVPLKTSSERDQRRKDFKETCIGRNLCLKKLVQQQQKKVQDSKCSREFQTWWAEKYGMINKGDKAVCVLCSGTVQKELIASAIKDGNKQSTQNCHTSAASYSAANAIARHGKPFQEGEFLKEAWLAWAPSLFDDFDNKDKIIQRIKDVPLSRNTMKDRILKLAENVTDQQKNDINSATFISLCLDESIDITKSARLAVFARYCVGNIIKEELIAITSLLTTAKGTDICTTARNSLAEKGIDLKKIVSVTTDGAPNMVDAQEKRTEEKVIDDFISIMDSFIKEFSARFSLFKELLETFKFIMYPDVISFDKLNMSQFDWLEIEELEMQLIDF